MDNGLMGPHVLVGRAGPGIEIRRILLLTRLREKAKGMTMNQLVEDCGRVPGWNTRGDSLWESVRLVLQSLIDDRLVAAKARFGITEKGREYLEDPLKWRIEVETREELEERLFWKSILEVFDRAYSRLRSTVGSPQASSN